VANSCCAATDSWCVNTGATTSGCTHFQDEASCATDRCYWGGSFCQSRGATGYGEPATACEAEAYALQHQCPAGRCAWSQTKEACEPSPAYGLSDLKDHGMSSAEAYTAGYTPQAGRAAYLAPFQARASSLKPQAPSPKPEPCSPEQATCHLPLATYYRRHAHSRLLTAVGPSPNPIPNACRRRT
jgi:hypothetical protein